MLPTHGSSRLVRGGLAAFVVAAGLTLTACPTSALALPTLPTVPPLPIPTPTVPITVPPLPVPTPTLPLPPLRSSPGLPGLPGTTGAGLPLNQPPLSLPGSAGGVSGVPAAPGGIVGSTSLPPTVDASVLSSLLGLLGTPAGVGVEQPSLEHLTLPASVATGRLASATGGRARPSRGPAAVLWPLATIVLVALIAGVIARTHRKRLSRHRVVAAVPLVALAGLVSAAAVQGTWFPATPATASALIAVAGTASRTVIPAAGTLTTGAAVFNRFMSFETQISRTEEQLRSPSTDRPVAQIQQEHHLATSLETTLQNEYAFFAAVAGDPAQSTTLLQAAATQPAAVSKVVSYDVQAVQAHLAQQAAIAQAAHSNSVAASTPAIPAAPGLQAAPASGWVWPMSGVITQGFGPSALAFEPAVTLAGITYPHFHTGIDIASAFGTPVQAATAGVVALAGAETDALGHLVGYGNYVVIAHPGNMITLYGHLEQVLVHPGQAVRAADPIGLEGSTGNSTGAHVHFELRIAGVITDPAGYVARR